MERIKYPLFFLWKICYWNNRITDKIGARLRKKLTTTEKQDAQMRFKADKIPYA